MQHTHPSPIDADNGVADSGAGAEWLGLARAVSAAMPSDASELWLGQLVFEVQKASERAVAAARVHADSLVAEARLEAIGIREEGRRWAQAASRLRNVMQRAAVGHTRGSERPQADLRPPRPRTYPPRPGASTLPRPPSPSAEGPRPPVLPTPTTPSRTPNATLSDDDRTVPASPFRPVAVEPFVAPSVGWHSRVPSLTRHDRGPAPAPASATPAVGDGTDGGPAEAVPKKAAVVEGATFRGPQEAKSDAVVAPGSDNARQKQAPRRIVRSTALLGALALITSALGLVAFEHYGTALRERSAQTRLMAQFTAAATHPTGVTPAQGSALGLLTIPRLAIKEQAVVEGATVDNLRRGPAHDTSSPQPGQRGAVVILGHRRTYGGPFGRLADLRFGDVVSLRTTSGLFVYRVSRTAQVLGAGSKALELPSTAQVRDIAGAAGQVDHSLVLATGGDSRGNALEVVVAILLPQGTTGDLVGAAATGVTPDLRSVPGEGVGLVLLTLWGAILVAIVYFHRRLWLKVPGPVLVVTGSVAILIATYNLYLAVDRLLPGTY